MADGTVDNLQIQLSADADKATRALNNFANCLKGINTAFTKDISGMRKFSKEVGTMAAAIKSFGSAKINIPDFSQFNVGVKNITEFSNAVKSLSNLSIKMPQINGATKEIDILEEYAKKSANKMSSYFQSAFGIKSGDMSNVKKAVSELTESIAKRGAKGFAENFDNLGDSIIKAVSNIKIADAEMEAFYQTVKKVGKIRVSPEIPKALPDEWKNMDGLLRQKMTTQSGVGTELDSLMHEWKNNFRGLFSNIDLDNVEDQFVGLNELIKQCREGIGSPVDEKLLQVEVWEKALDSAEKYYNSVEEVKKALSETGTTKEIKGDGLENIANTMSKLSKIKTDGLATVSDSFEKLSYALRSMDGIQFNVTPIMQAVELIERLGKKSNASGTENLKAMSENLDKVAKSLSSVEAISNALRELRSIKFEDNNLNKVIRSLQGLLSVNFSAFNPDALEHIVRSISAISNIPDISNSVNRFVSSVSRLSNAGGKTGQSANDIYRLGQETKKAADELATVGHVSDDINMFVQSVGRLASAGGKTSQTAAGLGNLAEETKKFFKAMKDTPIVSENTIRMTQALAQLASAGGKVGSSTSTITNSFEKLSTIGMKTSSAMKKIASGIASAFKKIGDSSKHVKTAQFSLLSLAKTAVAFKVGYGLLEFGKQAFELGSGITEVENVVDTAFGSMADKAYEFADTAKEQFGLSELSAKKYAGTLMAMLNSTGVAQETAAEMSIGLAGLAGDLASFYNIDTDVAFKKLQSAMAGEIEPMRELGVNMTVNFLLRLYAVMYIESLRERKLKRCAA